ncbi:MAG: hypothetical protein IJT34_02505 [Butyrivibrio sp.]|nr:hypothetical protein [Butyrivibrio sp.]
MTEHRRVSERINLRCFYLRLLRRLWVLIPVLAAGAVTGLVTYYLAVSIFGPGIQYETNSTLYIDFAYDPETGTLVDYYNAYTWNTLIPTDEMTKPLVDALAGEGVTVAEEGGQLTREALFAAIRADIPSDVRVMVVTVTHPDRGVTEAITRSVCKALVHYGKINDAFDQIRVLQSDEKAHRKVWTDRSAVAAGLGAVLFLLGALCILLLMEAMDDAVYVPEEAAYRYQLPVLGVLTREAEEEPSMLRGELIASVRELEKKVTASELSLFHASDREEPSAAARAAVRLGEVLGQQEQTFSCTPCTLSRDLRGMPCIGAVVAIPMGQRERAMTEHLLSQLAQREIPILGLLLTEADGAFLKRYYRL